MDRPIFVVTSRDDFKELIDLRMAEAKLLLDGGSWDGAYYLAGYAVEFALKICMIAQLMKSDAYPEKRQLEQYYRHTLADLLKGAQLDDQLSADAGLQASWKTVKQWNEQSRYQTGRTEEDAKGLYKAIEKEVLPWIKRQW